MKAAHSLIATIALSLALAASTAYAAAKPADATGASASTPDSNISSPNNSVTELATVAEPATAQPSSTIPAPAPVPSAKPQSLAAASEAPGTTFGFEQRFRAEGYNNADMNQSSLDKMRQVRFRARAYADINFNSYLEAFIRVANEGYKRTSDPSFPLSASGAEQSSPYMTGEFWFDSAYLK